MNPRKAAVAPDNIKLKPRANVQSKQAMLRKGIGIMAWDTDIRPIGIRKGNWAYRTRKGNAKPSDCRTV